MRIWDGETFTCGETGLCDGIVIEVLGCNRQKHLHSTNKYNSIASKRLFKDKKNASYLERAHGAEVQ